VLALIALIGLLTASIAYAVALWARNENTYASIIFTATLPILLLSGVLLPMGLAPQWLRNIAAANPLSYAVEAARANARLNRASAAITFVCATGVNARAIAAAKPYDLIFANILLGPLLRLAVPLSRLAALGGRVVLSGLLPGHANAVLAIYRAQGFVLERRIALDGWVTLVLKNS